MTIHLKRVLKKRSNEHNALNNHNANDTNKSPLNEPLPSQEKGTSSKLQALKKKKESDFEKNIENILWTTFSKTFGNPIEAMVQNVLDETFGKKLGKSIGKTLEGSVSLVLEEILEKMLGRVMARHLEGLMEELVEQSLGKVLTSALDKTLTKNLESAIDKSLNTSLENALRRVLENYTAPPPKKSIRSRIYDLFKRAIRRRNFV